MTALIDGGADIEAKERDREQTPLIFAAAAGRAEAVKLLLAKGANKNAATKTIDLMALSANGENPDGRNLAAKPETANGAAARGAASARTPAASRPRTPGLDRGYLINEQVHTQGGMTPLLFAARQGYVEVAAALLDAGVDVNQRKKGDDVSAMLAATINGHFDFAKMLLDRGADPEPGRRERRRAALCRHQPDVGAAGRLSAAARAPQPEDRLPRVHEGAARQGRRPERPRQQEGVVLELQLRSVRRGGNRLDRLLARRLRGRRRRDEAARL